VDDDFERHLSAALATRPVIEQAKGVLAGVRRETPDQAFAELRHVSHHHNVKLNVLASAVVVVASGKTLRDARLRKVIWQEWDDVLPQLPRPRFALVTDR